MCGPHSVKLHTVNSYTCLNTRAYTSTYCGNSVLYGICGSRDGRTAGLVCVCMMVSLSTTRVAGAYLS